MASTDGNDTNKPPWIHHSGVRNLRDIGGYATAANSYVRKNYVFRSAAPQQLTAEGIAAFKATGITTVFDLRSAREILEHPNMPPLNYIAGVEYNHVPVFDESWSPEAMLARYGNYLSGTPLSNYVDILSSLPVSLSPILQHILNRPDDALLIHCTAGKDRTGVIAGLLLSAIGVEDKVVAKEYALTQLSMGKMLAALGDRAKELPVFKKLKEQGIHVSEEGIQNLLSSEPETLEGLLTKIRKDGGVEKWLRDHCEIEDEELEKLTEVLTVADLIQD